jgi:ankyrin repeat protein
MGKTYPSVDSIKNLIKNGVDINCVDKDGSTPLLCLIQKKVDDDDKSSVLNADLIDIIRLLIKNGIDVNSKDRDGSNTLHLLSRNYKKENLIDIIRLLLENGIDVNCKDKNGDKRSSFLL